MSAAGSGVDEESGSLTATGGGGAEVAAASSASSSSAMNRPSTAQHASGGSPSSLGEASGVAILLGNHAKFGLAERCCYHFDLINSLTSLPVGRSSMQLQQQQARMQARQRNARDRGLSISSYDGAPPGASATSPTVSGGAEKNTGESCGGGNSAAADGKADGKADAPAADRSPCICGVVSLLECVGGGVGVGAQNAQQPHDRTALSQAKRALRSKHREFNTRAQLAWGRRGTRSGTSWQKRVEGAHSDAKSGGATASSAVVGGATARRICHQPRHLPLPLNPNTRVTFAYELTNIAILIDASPSLTSTFGMSLSRNEDFGMFDVGGEEKKSNGHASETCCMPIDRVGPILKTYLKGLVQPIVVPPVAVGGLGVAFGNWTPNLAVTVVAVYPPTSNGDPTSAALLVRDYRVVDEGTAAELARNVERWALSAVESKIAQRLCGEGDFTGDGVAGRSDDNAGGCGSVVHAMSPLGDFSLPSPNPRLANWTRARSNMKDMLAVGDAALATLPAEGRPTLLIITDCRNVHCGGVFDALSETARSDVPVSVLDISSSLTTSQSNAPGTTGQHDAPTTQGQSSSIEGNTEELFSLSSFPLSVSNDSHSLKDSCDLSGGIFLSANTLEACIKVKAGSTNSDSPYVIRGDIHFSSVKKRSIKPNALQWYTLFNVSPLTPSGSALSYRHQLHSQPSMMNNNTLSSLGYFRSSSVLSGPNSSNVSGSSTLEMVGRSASSAQLLQQSNHGVAPTERIVFAKYNIQPIRIKSLLMTRILEGYHAKRYGHNTQDHDKVSVHLVLRLADCGVTIHYEASFVSSPYHIPTVGQAHIKIELSGEDAEFIQMAKKMFVSHQQGAKRVVSTSAKAAADKICKLLRWTRKEDYLESYLCTGWGDVDHFKTGSKFLQRLMSLSSLARYRHFRTESFELVTIVPNYYEQSESFFSHLEANVGEEEMYSALSNWSTVTITDRKMYVKVITEAQEDDLAYYCILRVMQSLQALFTITIDFHGELNAEERLAILFTLKEKLREHSTEIVVLDKCIRKNVALRPQFATSPWSPSWNEYFLHHKRWELLQEQGVLALITKRRTEFGNFVTLMQDDVRAVFAKIVKGDIVIYQVLSRKNGIVVDFHMEASRSTFYPFHEKHTDTGFYGIYSNVKRRDIDCAKNIRSRRNLLTALDHSNAGFQAIEDVKRLIKRSYVYRHQLRFFNNDGSGSANDILSRLTTDYITSNLTNNQAAKLLINQQENVLGHSGIWFIMKVDWYVLSIVCLELKDQDVKCDNEKLQSFRHLCFYTVGNVELYQSDVDVDSNNLTEILSDDDHFGVTDIASKIAAAHARNYSRACYEALRGSVSFLREDEVGYVMSHLRFKQVVEILVAVDDLSAHLSSSAQTMTGSKLGAVIETLLRVVPGSCNEIFFYSGPEMPSLDDDATRDTYSDLAGDVQSFLAGRDAEAGPSEREAPELQIRQENDNSPIFFRFTLNEEPASHNEILALKKSATLAAQVSVFSSAPDELPNSHVAVVSKLQRALRSFTSEQSLEKFRYSGRSLSHDDFNDIMNNISKTKHAKLESLLEFFVSGAMTQADELIGSNNNDLEHGYFVLMEELDNAAFTIRANNTSFLVLDDSASRDVLPYWCFIQIQRSSGKVIIRVHHPLGDAAAEEQAHIALKLFDSICERTNQLLLLESLYKTKIASDLLILEETSDSTTRQKAARFVCPVQHKTVIPLHRRCAPTQAILSLETTILQNFTTNRRGVFVYKDEHDKIFYMKFQLEKLPNADDAIELLVYGVNNPGPSITEQLVSLLQRKLLTLTLDALSSLLTKNPWFNLLDSDVTFIRCFASAHDKLSETGISTNCDCARTYVLPSHVNDPLIMMLMFRQNICGNTFIHHLRHESNTAGQDPIQVEECGGKIERVCFTKLPEFHFYFNSSPSQLDPNYQKLETLTSRGRELARQAGSGIAIIEVSLQHHSLDTQGENVVIANKKDRILKEDITICEYDPDFEEEKQGRFKLRVEIINTTVDIDIIHKWVELSLSQVLIAWSIERHLEASGLGLLKHDSKRDVVQDIIHPTKEQAKLNSTNALVPGLQGLEDMIRIASDLPHPAIIRYQHKSMLKATSLASITLEMITQLSSIVNIKKPSEVLRYTTRDGASFVSVKKDARRCTQVLVTEGERKGTAIKDKPTDSPEYTVVIGSSDNQKSFFTEVSARMGSEQSDFLQAVVQLKSEKPTLFQRRLVFVLRISRSIRDLMIYNVAPKLRAKMELAFNEVEQEAVKNYQRCCRNLQSRCMPHISFLSNDSIKQRSTTDETFVAPKPKPVEKKAPQPPTNEEAIVKRPARRIPRPTSMLRPKLIGKSVEGAAMQAVAANRLRASSRPSIPQRAPTGKKKVAATAPQREKPREKTVAIGSQKKKIDATGTARSSAPCESLFRTYQAFLSFLKEGSEALNSESRLTQSNLQHLSHAFITSSNEKAPTLLCTRLFTCYGHLIDHGSIQPLVGDDENSLAKFIGHLTSFLGAKATPDEKELSRGPLPQFIYLTKEVLATESRKIHILLEISTPWDSSLKTFIFSYKAWLFISAGKTNATSKSFSLLSHEWEAAVIEAVATGFLRQLNLEQEVYNFAGIRLMRMARGIRMTERGITTLPLLKSIITRFGAESQSLLPFPGYRLQRRFLSISTFLESSLMDCCEKETLIEHMLSDSNAYGLTYCGKRSNPCFCGRLDVSGWAVIYFMGWHETVESALDVFVLCVTNGRRFDTFVTKVGSPYAEEISHVVLHSAMTTVQDIVTKASTNIRKMRLWQLFGDEYSTPLVLESTLIEGIGELRKVSYNFDLFTVDSRLKTLLCDELNDLNLPWRDIFKAAAQSPSFSHCLICDENKDTIHFLLYCHEDSVFLDFVFDVCGKVQQAQILTKELLRYNESFNSKECHAVRSAVQKLTLFFLQWIWKDCEVLIGR